MKCDTCHRPVRGGQEALRRAEYRRQPNGTVKVFGAGMPDGPLSAATGQLEKVKHNGCYHADRKRAQRSGR